MRDTGFPGVPRLSKGMYKKLHAFSKMQAKVDLFLPVASKRALLSC
jgi:steroid 5-alpha reductase family enzyme